MAKLVERIATLKAKKASLDSRLALLSTKARAQDRKRDARRKIVVGAAVLAHMEHDAQFALLVTAILQRNVTRPQDIEVLRDLLPAAAPSTAHAAM